MPCGEPRQGVSPAADPAPPLLNPTTNLYETPARFYCSTFRPSDGFVFRCPENDKKHGLSPRPATHELPVSLQEMTLRTRIDTNNLSRSKPDPPVENRLPSNSTRAKNGCKGGATTNNECLHSPRSERRTPLPSCEMNPRLASTAHFG